MSNKYIDIMKQRQTRRQQSTGRRTRRSTRTPVKVYVPLRLFLGQSRYSSRGGTRKSRVNSTLIVVGKIFSNNCGHCTAMANDWTALKQKHPTLITDETDIEASEMDTKLPALKAKYNVDIRVDGFPTIYKIIKSHNGSCYVVLYEGPSRTTQAMHKWILEK